MLPGMADYGYHKEMGLVLPNRGVGMKLRGFTGTSLSISMPGDNNELAVIATPI